MDGSTITLLVGVISCIVGIATFISGMVSRAQREGVLEQKINQALEGIDEIKKELKEETRNNRSLETGIKLNEERINTLFHDYDFMKGILETTQSTNQALMEIMNLMKSHLIS